MNEIKHTAEPWRWEFNEKHKTVSITGGRPKFDLTVMDFERWGMGGAVPRFRDTEHDGMNVMHRLCDRKDWFAPYAGREHHAGWHANVIHPDARRIVACVNACAGLDTDYLENVGLPEFVGKTLCADLAQQELDAVTAQRDQLLAQRDMLIQQNARLTQDGLENLEALGKVVRQRDQLIGLLRKFDGIMDGCGNWPDTSSSQVSLGDLAAEARSTIAAVEGGAG